MSRLNRRSVLSPPFRLLWLALGVAGVAHAEEASQDWPSFRGPGGRGVAEGYATATQWNADPSAGETHRVLWSTEVPGLGHSSPVISGDRLFLTTALADAGEAELKVGRGGQPDAADDHGQQSWLVLCYDKNTGDELWRRVARHGQPRATRHAKATHANATVAVSGNRVVAFFGSEGAYCYSADGALLWRRDLGVINVAKYGIGWGFASSPAIHGDRIALVCDDVDNPFLCVLNLADGSEVWRVKRKEVCERSWGSPFVHAAPERTQIVVNGWPSVVSYGFERGAELWRINGGGDNPVPTPFEAHGWFYITSSHGSQSPIYVVHPDAQGDLTPDADSPPTPDTDIEDLRGMVWSNQRGGSYMSTPVVYRDYLYLGNSNGVLRCYHAKTGEQAYQKRLGSGVSIIASLVATHGKVYCTSEDGSVIVVKAGADFEVLARNAMGDPCFATPAISNGVLYFRTTKRLIAIE